MAKPDHSTSKATGSRLITWRLVMFLLGMALVEASRTLTMVQVPVYLREQGANIREIGLFFTIALVFPLILRILGGWFSDSVGRLRALTIGSITGALAYLAYTLAPTWRVALIGPALLAVAVALVFPSYKAYIADHSTEHARGRLFGIAEAVIAVAWIIGPPIGGFLAENLGYSWMFATAALAFAASGFIFFSLHITRDPSLDPVTSKPTLLSLRGSLAEMLPLLISGGLITWVLITDGVRDVAFKLSFELMPVYLSDIANMSKQTIGLLDGIFGISIACTLVLAGWLVDKTSERLAVVLGLGFVIASRLVFAIAQTFAGFAVSWSLLGIGAGLFDPAYGSLIAKGVPSRLRGITFGLVVTSLGIISLPSPWIGSQIWTHFGPKAPFFTTVVIGTLAIIPAWLKLVPPEKLSEAQQPETDANDVP
ncbi:MAG: MFS transporter [Anaerolineales bacterium]|jgi:MFS family permease